MDQKTVIKKVAKQPKRNAHYVDNAKFLEAIVAYRKDCRIAKRDKSPKPRLPEYLGECLLHIATHLSSKPCFSNYMFREDMISDGVENCLQYFDNFDPKKSKNPFSYFTQTIYFAFIRRIKKEKKQLYIKFVATQQDRENKETGTGMSDFDRFMVDFIENYEDSSDEKKKKVKKPRKRDKQTGPQLLLVDDE